MKEIYNDSVEALRVATFQWRLDLAKKFGWVGLLTEFEKMANPDLHQSLPGEKKEEQFPHTR